MQLPSPAIQSSPQAPCMHLSHITQFTVTALYSGIRDSIIVYTSTKISLLVDYRKNTGKGYRYK